MVDILETALEVVQERGEQYGDPTDNHKCTAAMWSAYLMRRFPDGKLLLTSRDVCVLNILQKVSRDAFLPKDDNLVDIAGWAWNAKVVS